MTILSSSQIHAPSASRGALVAAYNLTPEAVEALLDGRFVVKGDALIVDDGDTQVARALYPSRPRRRVPCAV